MLNFSPYSLLHKNPEGAVSVGNTVEFCVVLPKDYDTFCPVIFAIQEDGKHWEEHICRQLFVTKAGEKQIGIQWRATKESLYFYKFFARKPDGTICDETPVYQQTVYSNNFTVPKWLSEGVMYQIFPDRFKKSDRISVSPLKKDWIFREIWGEDPFSGPDENGVVKNNDFFCGNIKGIEESLPYLESLGVTVIYLNPIFEAYSNHRYDTADYMKIDPLLGSEEDFRSLCKTAALKGIRIILDGVFNHTGSHSIYFNKDGAYDSIGAYQSKESPYYPWYSFSNWPDQYASWWGIDTLPNLCEEQPSVLEYMIKNEESVIAYWLKAGASGFRLDVADELPDGFLDALRIKVKEMNPDACIIGEVWEDATNKIAYGIRRRYFLGAQLDSVMNYPLKDSMLRFLLEEGSGQDLAHLVCSLKDHYPQPAFNSLMNILGTHDTQRIRTLLSVNVPDAKGKQRLYGALLLWAFMPGIPCIYYGDEIGMQGGKDPMNRRCFEPEWADGEIQEYYSAVLAFRRKVSDLADRPLWEVYGEKSTFSFIRKGAKDNLCIFVNMDSQEHSFDLDPTKTLIDSLSNGAVVFEDNQVKVPPGISVCFRLAFAR